MKKKTIRCKHCREIHKIERKGYYCPKVFGGWVSIAKKKPAPKIVGYRKSLNKRLDGKWEWACPVWFTKGLFADAWIKGTNDFETQEAASADMEAKLKLFGVTKRTENLNIKTYERLSKSNRRMA